MNAPKCGPCQRVMDEVRAQPTDKDGKPLSEPVRAWLCDTCGAWTPFAPLGDVAS